ncbi:MAG TPA: NADPH-dependent FMN reductase, partial [Burkholderiales bacterium]|nr:NADPH-dependent FMN reductase [Burkholderiales bacterium]
AFIVASPMYRGTYTGALKNVLDHLPLEALEGKVVGIIATGATPHHYLAIDHDFRAVLAWFNAYVLPGSVYLDHTAYADGALVDAARRASLTELGRALVTVALKLKDVRPTPPCLARESMKAGGKK